MKRNKIILNNCKNFYKIKEYDYDEDDFITSKLISVYEEFVFSIDETNKSDIEKIKTLDMIIGKYLSDYTFKKEVQNSMLKLRIKKDSNIVNIIVNYLLNMFDDYLSGYTRNIYFARWI